MAIDIPALVVTDHTAAGALADVDLINGSTNSDDLPLGDELFDNYALNAGIDVGGAWVGADLAGHVDPPSIVTGDNKSEKCDEKKQT
ncbi:hypothetical protein GCM10009132_10180 [Serratia ureilytica]